MSPLFTVAEWTLLGVLALVAGLLLFTYQMARKLLRPERRAMAITPEDVGLRMNAVRIPSPRGTLAGWYLPSRNGCTLICCHGINDKDQAGRGSPTNAPLALRELLRLSRLADAHSVDTRTAAYMLAIDRVAYDTRMRGIYA